LQEEEMNVGGEEEVMMEEVIDVTRVVLDAYYK